VGRVIIPSHGDFVFGEEGYSCYIRKRIVWDEISVSGSDKNMEIRTLQIQVKTLTLKKQKN
jgi:hypothetical protein